VTLAEYLLKHKCERPDLRLSAENDWFRTFICLTCKETWVVTRSKVKTAAREDARLAQVRKISEDEAARMKSAKVFGAHYRGARHV
jgi:hypothetical protein